MGSRNRSIRFKIFLLLLLPLLSLSALWGFALNLTVGDGQDTEISLSRDGKKLAYTKKNQSTGIWSFPFNPISGEVRNVGRQVTPEGVDAWFPDLTADGSGLIFSVSKQGMTNHELWQELLEASAPHKVEWHWVKGHSGHPENDRVDALACAEADKLR